MLGKNSVEGFVIHGNAAHESQYRFFIGHGCSHARNPAEVSVETFYPVVVYIIAWISGA